MAARQNLRSRKTKRLPPSVVTVELKWRLHLRQLRDFIAAYEQLPVHLRPDDDHESMLGSWLYTQQRAYRMGTLKDSRAVALSRAVPGWDDHRKLNENLEARWRGRLKALAEYAADHGLPLSGETWERDGREWDVGDWLLKQRCAQDKNKLSKRRVAALNEAVPGWDGGK